MKQFEDKIRHENKNQHFDKIMNFNTFSVDVFKVDSILKDNYMKHKKTEKQYALAFVAMKNGKVFKSDEFYPCHKNRNAKDKMTEKTKHSEEKLIQEIDKFLQKNSKNVQGILIFTLNSPCLKREKQDIQCCMYLILRKATEWYHKYGIITHAAFSKFWGLSGPNIFKRLTVSEILDQNSVFYPYFKASKKITFKLEDFMKENEEKKKKTEKGKEIKGKIIKETLPDVENIEKNNLKNDIISAVHNLMVLAKHDTNKHKHCENGEKFISSLKFSSKVHNKISEMLRKAWSEIVNNSFMLVVRDKITADFNRAVVNVFLNDINSLGLNYFQIYQVQFEDCV